MILVGVRRSGSQEFALSAEWRARWLATGGRILREEDGAIAGEPIALSEFRRTEAPAPIEQAQATAARKPGRPPGSKTRRGIDGGDTAIKERLG